MSKNKKRSIFSKENELKTSSLIKRALIFCGVFAVLTVIFVLIGSLIAYNTENPSSLVDIIAIVCPYLSALVSSFLLSKINGQKYLLSGLILGAFILAIIIPISILIKNDNNTLGFLLVIPLFTVLGCMLGQKREKRRKHKHRT